MSLWSEIKIVTGKQECILDMIGKVYIVTTTVNYANCGLLQAVIYVRDIL
jgi:hypothetical protein